jgi:hypothetical protein
MLTKIRKAITLLRQSRDFGVDQTIGITKLPGKLVDFYLDHFFVQMGANRSFQENKPITHEGAPLPWYTYSCIEYIRQLDLSECKVLEFGSGNSSCFWARSGASVTSVESNGEWLNAVTAMKIPNHQLIFAEEVGEYILSGTDISGYDIVVIDGVFRYDCAKRVIESCSSASLVILDNSDWYPNTCSLFLSSGYTRVDFAGPGPINPYPWCTSVFFRGRSRLRYKTSRPVVLGGLPNWVDNNDDTGK